MRGHEGLNTKKEIQEIRDALFGFVMSFSSCSHDVFSERNKSWNTSFSSLSSGLAVIVSMGRVHVFFCVNNGVVDFELNLLKF